MEKLKKELADYWRLDRRGALLNLGLLLSAAVVISLVTSSEKTGQLILWPAWSNLRFGLIFLSSFVVTAGLGLRFPIFAGAFAVAVAVAFAVAGAVAFAVAKRYQIIEMFQQRADSANQQSTSVKATWDESNQRREAWEMLRTLLSRRSSATLGLAGRRGTGKTDFLNHLLNQNNSASAQPTLTFEDFKEEKFLSPEQRLRTITCFVRSPADFDEMSFLSALFEQVTLSIDAALTRLIPAVKPYPVARELQSKAIHQRFVHRLYVLLYVLLLAPLGIFIFILPNRFPENASPPAFTQPATDSLGAGLAVAKIKSGDSLSQKSALRRDSLRTAVALTSNRLYQAFLDSLARQTYFIRDSLRQIEKNGENLLDPPTSRFLQKPYWYESGGRFSIERKVNYLALLDSLLHHSPQRYQPLLDSLAQQFRAGQARLDTIATQTRNYQQLAATLADYDRRLQQTSRSGKIPLNGLWLIFGTLIFLPAGLWIFGRERGSSLYDPRYQPISNEIALYRRTQEVLARLHFHHSFGEEQSLSFGWAGNLGLSLGMGKSKQVTREQVPFTLLSLVEEYRNYLREVCSYLNRALEEDPEEAWVPKRREKKTSVTTNQVKIYIAIDELDKVLDIERLHQMLKSIKAIFDLDHVYYLLSISEDALGTYRLRNVETKNEVDSAFTHILLIPPLEATASIEFFRERGIPANFIAPLVVYGAGVPRDMHRLADIALAKTEPKEKTEAIRAGWKKLGDCVCYFFEEDKQAISDLISQQPGLSDVWKQKLLDLIEQDNLTTAAYPDDHLKNLSEIDLQKFIEANPGTTDENRKLFFKLHALVSGYFVKNHLHRQLLGFETAWFKNTKDDFKSENLPQEIVEWLELRRAAVYEISSNPLGAWERLKKAI